jgi:hypothetical protein
MRSARTPVYRCFGFNHNFEPEVTPCPLGKKGNTIFVTPGCAKIVVTVLLLWLYLPFDYLETLHPGNFAPAGLTCGHVLDSRFDRENEHACDHATAMYESSL